MPTTKKTAAPAATSLPKGALSLTYNLLYDLQTQTDFQSNRTKVMNAFGLDKNAQAIYERCGQLGKPDDVTMVALMALGLPELREWETTAGTDLGTDAKGRKGPLSLLYHVIFDKGVKADFIKDPEKVMNTFGLDDGKKTYDQKWWFRFLREESPAWDPRLVGLLAMASSEVTDHYNDPW